MIVLQMLRELIGVIDTRFLRVLAGCLLTIAYVHWTLILAHIGGWSRLLVIIAVDVVLLWAFWADLKHRNWYYELLKQEHDL